MTTSKSVLPAQGAVAENAVENAVDNDHNEHSVHIDAAIQGALGRKLRESYEEVVREEVPDKLLLLLDQLKNAESKTSKG